MSGSSGSPHRATIVIIAAVLAVPAATLLTLHILQDRRYAELLGDLNHVSVEFVSKVHIVCGGGQVPRLAGDSDRNVGSFAYSSTSDNRADQRWRTWYLVLHPPSKDESCSPFGFQIVCEQRRKWKIFLAPQVRLHFLNLPDDALMALLEQGLKARGVPYTVSNIVAR